MMRTIIVSRHPATPKWLVAKGYVPAGTPVFAENVKAEDVQGRIVFGNLPLHLAVLAAEYHAVEFAVAPPRGSEVDEMDAAGAMVRQYRVEVIE